MTNAEPIPDPIPEEALSAYLDGELSESEILRVEQQLERDADLRQALTELSEIRDQIKQLPKHALSSDFASRIASQIAEDSTNTPEQPVVTPRTLPSTGKQNRLRLAGVLSTVAALLLVSLLGIQYLPVPNVAMNTDESEAVEASRPTNNEGSGPGGLGGLASQESADVPFENDTISMDDVIGDEAASFTKSRQVIEPFAELKQQNDQIALRSDSYGLVAEYQVNAQQLEALSLSWKNNTNVMAVSEDQDDSSFVLEGTFEEVSELLRTVQAQTSKIEGIAKDQFVQQGLAFHGGKQTLQRSDFEQPPSVAAVPAPQALAEIGDMQRGLAAPTNAPAILDNNARQVRVLRSNANRAKASMPKVELSKAARNTDDSVVKKAQVAKDDAIVELDEVESEEASQTVRVLVRLKKTE